MSGDQTQPNLTPTPTPSEQPSSSGMEGKAPQAWNNKRFREDYEVAKNRLSDTKYTLTAYPDPLMPRKGSKTMTMQPRVCSPEVEERLKNLLAAHKTV